MIELREVSKTYPGEGDRVVALDGVSFRVEEGETVCLIGTSGSGKTTALKTINGLVIPTGGEVRVEGRDLAGADLISLRRRIGYVVQSGGLFPHLSVRQNLTLLPEIVGWPAGQRRQRADELLELVGLPPEEFAGRRPRELSGGQQQRVSIARALALDPPILLMDEPFGALDPITRRELHGEFRRLEAEVKKTVVLVTHDLEEAFALGDRIALLDGGRLHQIGPPEQLRDQPADAFVETFVGTHLVGMEQE